MIKRWLATPSGRDLGTLGLALVVIIATWVVLGWRFDRPVEQGDATLQWIPYLSASLDADWANHLYRFGILGGAQLHDAAGTLPLAQLCGALGLSATTSANAIAFSIQLGFAVFGIKAIESLIERDLTAAERVVATWACAFAPLLGWRIGAGHDNLLIGLLPWAAALSLVLAARANRLSGTMLVLGALAVQTGLSGVGAQTLVYSAVFGGPLLIAIIATSPRGARWTREHTRVALALLAGILIVLPRFAGMLAHAGGDDFARGHGSQLAQLGTASAGDWLSSIPWAANTAGDPLAHEHNVPIGPLLALAIARFPARRATLITWLAALVVAILFGSGTVVSDALAALPALDSFRVPARAVLPLLLCVPMFALAACWREPPPATRQAHTWLVIAIAAGLIAIGGNLPALVREPLAWLLCGGIVFALWKRPSMPAIALPAAVTAVIALGVVEFRARVPSPADAPRIEDLEPLRTSVLAELPELAMPLHRVALIRPPLPYAMSTAFAAGLPSLDGQWIPTRRFLALLSAASGKPIDPTTGVFQLGRTPMFPILQQLYDVIAVVDLQRSAIQRPPAPPGPAWFVSEIKTGSPDAIGATWHADIAAIRTTAWQVPGDPGAPTASPSCAQARVGVTTDDRGQIATIAVSTPADCTLVVSTNYVATLVAATGERELEVYPIDIALTGITVPRGTTEIVLGPRARVPGWTQIAALLGLVALLCAIVLPRLTRSSGNS